MEQKEKQNSGTWKSLFSTLKKLHLSWVWVLIALALNMAFNTMLLNLPDMTASLLGGDLSAGAIGQAVVYYITLGLMSFVMVSSQVQAQSLSVRKARESIWQKMLGMKMEHFDRNDPSDLMSTIINDTSSAVNSLVNVIIYLIPDLYYVIAALVRINQYHWVLALSCFALIPIKYLYALFVGKKMQTATTRLYGRIGQLTSFLADRINHLPLIKTYTNEASEGEKGQQVAGEILKANMKVVRVENTASGIVAVIGILQKFVVVVVAVILLQRKEIDLTMWLAFFLFTQNLFPIMDGVFDQWVKIKGIKGGFERTSGIMNGEDEEAGAAAFPVGGEIRFENVTFTYPGTEEPALKNVSFTVPDGGSVAIVGMCGSGKTTSVSLLERFYTPDSGKVTVGGQDIGEISLETFRHKLAYVQQGAGIFSGTLREALTYGIDRPVTDEEILNAARRTGFMEYLESCEEGLNQAIAPGGDSMSGGQKQRLVLTREVLRGGDVILMDEPTSALDVRVSAKIQDTMDEVFAGKTRILVTHDLDYARRCERMIVLCDGVLVGDGDHIHLMETCPTYRHMVENEGKEQQQ